MQIFTCSHLTSATAFASNFKNEFYNKKWLCSHLTFSFDGKDQRKTQKLSVNKALHVT